MARGQATSRAPRPPWPRPPALSRATWKSIFRKSTAEDVALEVEGPTKSARRRREKEASPGPQAGAPNGGNNPPTPFPVYMSVIGHRPNGQQSARENRAGCSTAKMLLTEANGNVDDAITILRKKAPRRPPRIRSRHQFRARRKLHSPGASGRAHRSRLRDRLRARNDEFKVFVRDLCLQIAAAARSTFPPGMSRNRTPKGARHRAAQSRQTARALQKIVEGKAREIFLAVSRSTSPFVKIRRRP